MHGRCEGCPASTCDDHGAHSHPDTRGTARDRAVQCISAPGPGPDSQLAREHTETFMLLYCGSPACILCICVAMMCIVDTDFWRSWLWVLCSEGAGLCFRRACAHGSPAGGTARPCAAASLLSSESQHLPGFGHGCDLHPVGAPAKLELLC